MATELDDEFDSDAQGPVTIDSEESSGEDSSAISIDYSLSAKDKERAELDRQVAEFLARGGKIDQVDTQLCGDPPQKPSNAYGSRPI